MRIEEILRAKGHTVVTIRSHATIETVLQRLRSENIGSLVVSDNEGRLDGIISERDIVRAMSEHGCEALRMRVKEVMTRNVETCMPGSKITDVMATMTRRRFRHMPVVADGSLVGIVSIGDIVKHRLEELEIETRVLRDYVVGNR
jgi:CBS domain-containing protein